MLASSLFLALALFPLEPPAREPDTLEELHAELRRFPPRETCRYWINYADEHLRWIEARQRLFPAERIEWEQYRQQVLHWRSVWDKLEDAQTDWLSVYQRWKALASVREMIGPLAYQLGFVWPPVAAQLLFIRPFPHR